MEKFFTIDWKENTVIILDQRLLPTEEIYLTLRSTQDVADAISTLAIRGAPAIGVAGAMGMALSANQSKATDASPFLKEMQKTHDLLLATRPTAVNLRWGLDRIFNFIKDKISLPLPELKKMVVQEAIVIKNEDIALNKKMGKNGSELFSDGDCILTHCNAGALATAGFGTALGVIYAAQAQGKKLRVFADETRPVLQGARLTAWELQKNNVDVTLITDNMAASLMRAGKIQKVIVGADRIAANGDVANKIGTYGVAVLARFHQIPFYVAAPFSTFDFLCPTGEQIKIEERDSKEISHIGEKQIAPHQIHFYNPAFDVTPANLVTAIVTERGIIQSPCKENLAKWN